MNFLFRLLFRDLVLLSIPRSIGLVIALGVGFGVAGTVAIANEILGVELDRNFIETVPPHAAIVATGWDAVDLDRLSSEFDLEATEFRDLSRLRAEVSPDRWLPLFLYGGDFSHQRTNVVASQSPAAAPAPNTMWVERDILKASTLVLGGAVRIRAAGEVQSVPISGIAFDPAQAPATQDAFLYGYVDHATFGALTGEAPNRRLLVRFLAPKSEADVVARTSALASRLKATGLDVERVTSLPYEHPHAWQLKILLRLFAALGTLCLLLAVLIVVQVWKALLARQVRQVGILRTLGATRNDVMRSFGAVLLATGVVAAVLAMPLALVGATKLSAFVAAALNFEVNLAAANTSMFVIVVGLCLVTPLFACLPALWRAASTAPKISLFSYGVTQEGARFRKLFTLRPGARSFLWGLAIRNVMRTRSRFILVMVTTAVGVSIFSAGFNVRASLWTLLDHVEDELQYTVQVVLREPISIDRATAAFSNVTGSESTEFWRGGRGRVQDEMLSTSRVGVVALPASTTMLRPQLISGRWLRGEGEGVLAETVVNQQAWEAYGKPKLGSEIVVVVGERQLMARLVGVVEQFEVAKLYLDIESFWAAFDPLRRVNTMNFAAPSLGVSLEAPLKREVEARLSSSTVLVSYVTTRLERVKIMVDHLDIILAMLVLLSALVLVVGASGLASAFRITVLERVREIGVLKAIGGSRRAIIGMFSREVFLVVAAAFAMGLVLSAPVSVVATRLFGGLMLGEGESLQLVTSPVGYLVTAAVCLLAALAPALLAARDAAQMSTKEALRHE